MRNIQTVRRENARINKQIEVLKLEVAKDIRDEIKDRKLSQTEAAHAMGDAASQVSLVCCLKLHGFSLERLLRMRARLGADVELVIKTAKNPKHGAVLLAS